MPKGLYANFKGIKFCAKCETEKPITGFFKHKQTSDGLHSWCKACCKEGNERSRRKKYSTFDGRITTFLRTCRNSALKRGQEFSITREDLVNCWNNQHGLCAYSGIEMTTQPSMPTSVSVERINNSIGYTADNTILVCNYINRMKTDMEYEQFYTFCRSVAEWLTGENGDMINAEKN